MLINNKNISKYQVPHIFGKVKAWSWDFYNGLVTFNVNVNMVKDGFKISID